jgi:hypothetical protein
MRSILLSAVALCALTSAALSDPLELTEAQMDNVAAGLLDNLSVLNDLTINQNTATVVPVAVAISPATAVAIGVFGGVFGSAEAAALSNSFAGNVTGVGQ